MINFNEVLRHCSDTKAVILGNGVLDQVADLFKKLFPGKKAVVVTDTDTYVFAGEAICRSLASGGVKQNPPHIFSCRDFFAEWTFVEELVEMLKSTTAIPIAVGSGTVNDLCKLASYLTGRRYMGVGTAASMDGYTSYGASIIKDGAKQTFDCLAPLAWLGDTGIICNAPCSMTASGYADLTAKIVAGADWILGEELGVDAINPEPWGIVQSSLRYSLAHPQAIRAHDPQAIGNLIEGLLLSGFAMQIHRSSRPSSGADHLFSHLWNMDHHTNHGKSISHGFQVAIGTLSSAALYECALNTDFTQLDVDKCVDAWPTLDALKIEAIDMFRGTDFPMIGVEETTAKYVDKEGLRKQLSLLQSKWPLIKQRLEKQLVPFDELRRRLQLVGAPVEPEEIGVSRDYLRRSYVRAQYIRRRFTILDLAVRTCNMQAWLDRLFSPSGRWFKLANNP